MSRAHKFIFVGLVCISVLVTSVSLAVRRPLGFSHSQAFSPRLERRGIVARVIDGDTLVVSGKHVRLVGINTPELRPTPEPGALEAKQFVENLCPPGEEVGLDIDALEPKDGYGRTLAVVYVNVDNSWINLNAELLRRGYAEVLYIPPSEFNPYDWIMR